MQLVKTLPHIEYTKTKSLIPNPLQFFLLSSRSFLRPSLCPFVRAVLHPKVLQFFVVNIQDKCTYPHALYIYLSQCYVSGFVGLYFAKSFVSVSFQTRKKNETKRSIPHWHSEKLSFTPTGIENLHFKNFRSIST